MAELLTATSEGVTLRQEIADAGSRLAAGIVDIVILVIGCFAVILGALTIASIDPSGLSGFLAGLVIGGAFFLIIGYHVLFHHFADGRTPGKMLLAIRVVAADGYPPSLFALLLRALIWPIDVLLFLPLPIGLYIIAGTPRRQRLGDLVAGTLAVHVRPRSAPPEPWPNERWSDLQNRELPLVPTHVARLDANDMDLLRELITRRSLEPEERRKLFVDTATYYCERLELGQFLDARNALRELYLFAREQRTARES